MFTRRQAIRWAELWLSCWNSGDLDTLLALHRDDLRFGDPSRTGNADTPPVDRKEALMRHWAVVACGIHSTPVDLEHVIWDPDTRELAIVYAAGVDGLRMRGCDLVTLDEDGRVMAGEPCVGSLVDDILRGQAVPAHHPSVATQGGR